MNNKYRRHSSSSMPPPPTRKRTHLKPSQVAVLQESFVTNPLPDATIRCQLARELGVTERTVQIWFQNRRAKARKLENGCSMNGSIPSLMPNVRTGWIEPPPPGTTATTTTPQRYQATFRTMMTPERFEEQLQQAASWQQKRSSKSDRAMPEGNDRMTASKSDRAAVITLPVTGLQVGTWARFSAATSSSAATATTWDLVCYAEQDQFVWQIQDGGHQFRIQIDFDAVQQLVLLGLPGQEQVLQVHLKKQPGFSMRRAGIDPEWIRCGDFTENKQASFQTIHTLQADDQLRQALLAVFNQSRDLLSKFTTAATPDLPPALDVSREFTLSPSMTPEPGSYNHWMNQDPYLIPPPPKSAQDPFGLLWQQEDPSFWTSSSLQHDNLLPIM